MDMFSARTGLTLGEASNPPTIYVSTIDSHRSQTYGFEYKNEVLPAEKTVRECGILPEDQPCFKVALLPSPPKKPDGKKKKPDSKNKQPALSKKPNGKKKKPGNTGKEQEKASSRDLVRSVCVPGSTFCVHVLLPGGIVLVAVSPEQTIQCLKTLISVHTGLLVCLLHPHM